MSSSERQSASSEGANLKREAEGAAVTEDHGPGLIAGFHPDRQRDLKPEQVRWLQARIGNAVVGRMLQRQRVAAIQRDGDGSDREETIDLTLNFRDRDVSDFVREVSVRPAFRRLLIARSDGGAHAFDLLHSHSNLVALFDQARSLSFSGTRRARATLDYAAVPGGSGLRVREITFTLLDPFPSPEEEIVEEDAPPVQDYTRTIEHGMPPPPNLALPPRGAEVLEEVAGIVGVPTSVGGVVGGPVGTAIDVASADSPRDAAGTIAEAVGRPAAAIWATLEYNFRNLENGDELERAGGSWLGFADSLARFAVGTSVDNIGPVPPDFQNHMMGRRLAMEGYTAGAELAVALIRAQEDPEGLRRWLRATGGRDSGRICEHILGVMRRQLDPRVAEQMPARCM